MGAPRWTTVVNVELMEALCGAVTDEGLQDRFWAKVDKRTIDYEDDCWIWTAALSSEGYGNFSVQLAPGDAGRRVVRAHRVAWFITYPRPLEAHHYLDHLFPVCRGRYCVNPMHLEPVDKEENDRRATGTTSANTQRFRRSEHLLERDTRELVRLGEPLTLEGAA